MGPVESNSDPLGKGAGPDSHRVGVYLDLLGQFVAERDDPDASSADAPAAVLPRILNKHTHGIPAGAVYIGRGSPWGTPFVIGRDGT